MELLKVIVKRLQALEDAYREHKADVERLEARVTTAEVSTARVASSVVDRGLVRPDSLDGRLRAIELAIASMDARLGVLERKHETLRQGLLAHEQVPARDIADPRTDDLARRVGALESRPRTTTDPRLDGLIIRVAALESRPASAADVPVEAAPGLRIVGSEERPAIGVLYLK